MSLPAHDPAQPRTMAQMHAWMHRASLKRRQLLLHGTASSQHTREQAFFDMGTLCLDALEAIRVLRAQLRKKSQTTRSRSAALHADAVRLIKIFQDEGRKRKTLE
jgi:hypothetical protein